MEGGPHGRGFPRRPEENVLRVYTTRPDTLFRSDLHGLSPPNIPWSLSSPPRTTLRRRSVSAPSGVKSDRERLEVTKRKTGVFTGGYARNPVNDAKVPVWIADYVLISYGTGRDHGGTGT
jgi:leucyl-tRNA synthetase